MGDAPDTALEMFARLGLVLILVVLAIDALTGASFLMSKVIEPVVRVFQKYILGIDRVRAGPDAQIGQTVRFSGDVADRRPGEQETFLVELEGERWRARLASGDGTPDSGQ